VGSLHKSELQTVKAIFFMFGQHLTRGKVIAKIKTVNFL